MNVEPIIDESTDPRCYAEEFRKLKISGTTYLEFRDVGELVRKYVKGKKTLDYGCGSGRSTIYLKSLGLSVTGVDINEHMIKYASEADVNGSYELITSANVSVDDNTYDLVFSSWVMPSVSSKSELLKIGAETSRILKPHGIFMMIVANKERFNKDWLTVNTEFPENRVLRSGCLVKGHYKDTKVSICSYFWTQEDYKEIIESSNMKLLEIHSPLGKDSDGYNWNLEKFVSPVDIYVAQKINNTELSNIYDVFTS